MGNCATVGASAPQNLSARSTDYFERQSTEYLRKRLKEVEDRGNKIVRENPVGLPWSHWEELKGEFYSLHKEANEIQAELSRRETEEAERRRREQPQQARTFVNSFGEATTREIETQTYKRAMRRQEQAVLRNMGVTPEQTTTARTTTTTRRRRRRRK